MWFSLRSDLHRSRFEALDGDVTNGTVRGDNHGDSAHVIDPLPFFVKADIGMSVGDIGEERHD
mgnify:CR=1 FL=1